MDNEFVIDTQKHCFLCLGATGNEYSSLDSSSPTTHSIQYLSKMLKLDRRKVFHEKGTIPEHLVKKVTKSRLMVELCGDCASWNESFAEKFQQLEKMHMEVFSRLSYLQEKFANTSNVSHITDKLPDMDEQSGAVLKGKLGIADMLRKDAIRKCDNILSTVHPRVRLQKMCTRHVITRKSQVPSNPIQRIKLEALSEETDFMDYSEDFGSHSRAEIQPDIDIDIKYSFDLPSRSQTTPPHKTRKVSINTDLSKLTKSGYERDQDLNCPNSEVCVKQDISIQPNIDEAEDNSDDLDELRYKCHGCSKTFSAKGNLTYHRRHSCGPRGRDHVHICHCEFCGTGFSTKNTLYQHLRRMHKIMRDIPCDLCEKMFYLESQLREHRCKFHAKL